MGLIYYEIFKCIDNINSKFILLINTQSPDLQPVSPVYRVKSKVDGSWYPLVDLSTEEEDTIPKDPRVKLRENQGRQCDICGKRRQCIRRLTKQLTQFSNLNLEKNKG
tara:strand:+ start:167 stop:490 length:324 start_codon:yes stop_codon:yes gene_type:complete